ncbi:MAG: SMC-Scp complex subunit ScpB [Candidatus Marsarchaeota archaeon]|jgi:segregation and condensation protein B|nr:SMC-Scp complex subunit ScpB [Candidatus Marsarchaeota archaeon]
MEQDSEYKKLVEAALFMSSSALGSKELCSITGIASPGIMNKILKELQSDYNSRDSAIEIVEIDSKYMFSLRDPYSKKLSSMATAPDISKGALRVLAYVSKNNGVLQSTLVKSFGSGIYEYVKELSEKGFVERKNYGRSKKLSVTSKFKEYFSA